VLSVTKQDIQSPFGPNSGVKEADFSQRGVREVLSRAQSGCSRTLGRRRRAECQSGSEREGI
jgi:hypothetical protein